MNGSTSLMTRSRTAAYPVGSSGGPPPSLARISAGSARLTTGSAPGSVIRATSASTVAYPACRIASASIPSG